MNGVKYGFCSRSARKRVSLINPFSGETGQNYRQSQNN
ncbi:hypothetical protein BFG60_3548 [Microcystis aeruginosa NIES-98]|nr:hypothetical protein BFG60_3548 [Microcystis aeruginosa NIES-98]